MLTVLKTKNYKYEDFKNINDWPFLMTFVVLSSYSQKNVKDEHEYMF